jgi:hypothetical protein
MVQKDQRIKEKDTYKKRGDEKVSIKKHSVPRLRLAGLCHKKIRKEQLKGRIMSENIVRGNIWNMHIYFLEPIPEKFGHSLGGYSHRERCRAPDRKKSTEGRREVKVDNKEPVDGRVVWM